MSKKELGILKVDSKVKEGLADAIAKRYVDRYADTIILMMEDYKRLSKAAEHLKSLVDRANNGDMEAVEQYKRERRKLEEIDGYEFTE